MYEVTVEEKFDFFRTFTCCVGLLYEYNGQSAIFPFFLFSFFPFFLFSFFFPSFFYFCFYFSGRFSVGADSCTEYEGRPNSVGCIGGVVFKKLPNKYCTCPKRITPQMLPPTYLDLYHP